ncbi:hypothetical protein jhhlp_006876 [Lomentospora prolificans]|uniref:PH domain-containing protein n=1 Tax=Lomentospora prolificans TaxID=41688 RepID=A0A2N3N2Z0_9PEZI|nr:hypothetical protein jhhlp_006876 [Lomentospora prolificans]
MATVSTSANAPTDSANTQPRNNLLLNPYDAAVNQNGSFESDRVIKAGKVQKRTQKTRSWKTVYLVLRPNTLSIYKNANEEKLRHKIYLTDLSTVAPLKDPKNKRNHVFGLFSPSKNFHFQAASAADAQEWLDLIRKEARIDEEDEEFFLASPFGSRQSSTSATAIPQASKMAAQQPAGEWLLSSSPECLASPGSLSVPNDPRHISQMLDSSGLSGNELASHSDLSDTETRQPRGVSIENLTLRPPIQTAEAGSSERPGMGNRNSSQTSGLNLEQDLDRVVWQGRLQFLRSKGGVRQWKKTWAVVRPRNMILYRDESEYTAKFILPMSSILNVVEIDPISKTKSHCLQIITEEKSYRFCATDEEELVRCLGAFKSLLTKRRELEQRLAAAQATMEPPALATTPEMESTPSPAEPTPPAAAAIVRRMSSAQPPPPIGSHAVLAMR